MKYKSSSSSSSSFKCLPNMFCIRNTTIFFIVILSAIGIYFFYSNYLKVAETQITPSMATPSMATPSMPTQMSASPLFMMSSRANSDVLEDPYAPPLRNDSYFGGINGGGGTNTMMPMAAGIPINVRTQGPPINTNYRQVGLLTRINGKETILPLMGRPLQKNRDKWQFYTMSDKNNSVKLPISFKKKSCTGEYGCDNIYNGDTVYVEGYKDAFQATIYDNAVMEYF
jgi:hypothetical protein